MIRKCPVNAECSLYKTVELPHCELFVGEVIGIYMEDRYLTKGKPDQSKIHPLLYEGIIGSYWRAGAKMANAFEIGKDYKKKQKRKGQESHLT